MFRILMAWFGWFLILVPCGLILVFGVLGGFGFADAQGMGTGDAAAFVAAIVGIGLFQAAVPIVAGMILVALSRMMKPEPERARRRRRW